MNILNIWHSGGVTEMLLAFAAIVSGIFWYQTYKAAKSGSEQQLPGGGYADLKKNIPFYQMPKFWLGVAVWVVVILALVFIVGPDYKGV